MKTALAVIVLFSLGLDLAAQSRKPAADGAPPQTFAQAAGQPAGPNLNAILSTLQQAIQAANGDLSRLRIEKWKAEGTEKQQLQRMAESLQKNITMALPGLIRDAQGAPGAVSRTFKLYDDVTVVYEYLSSLADAAGSYGKKEEYEPLANDASALEAARRSLSGYIDQAANALETQAQKPAPAQQTQTVQPPKKVVIDDDPAPTKKTKKKKAATPSTPSSSSSSASSPPQ
jgi:hypothetical protein